MRLALFDLDNTLIAGDSDYSWGEFLISIGAVDEKKHRAENDRYLRAYTTGELDVAEYQAFCVAPLAKASREQLDTWHRQFMREVIEPLMLPKAQALLAEHRARGDYLMIITATNRFVTEPIAEALGADELIAIDLETDDTGRYTGRISGVPSFQEGKVIRLEAWLEEHPEIERGGIYCYTDSHNDLPLLEYVDHPIAVDPDPTLADTARARGWPIISLRR